MDTNYTNTTTSVPMVKNKILLHKEIQLKFRPTYCKNVCPPNATNDCACILVYTRLLNGTFVPVDLPSAVAPWVIECACRNLLRCFVSKKPAGPLCSLHYAGGLNH